MNSEIVGAIGLAFVGACLTCTGLVNLVLMKRFKSRCECTTGKVVRMSDEATGEGGFPVVQYEVAGAVFDCVASFGGSYSYQIGDDVSVYFLPNRPEKGRTASRRQFAAAGVFIAIGTLFLTFGAMLYFAGRSDGIQ